MEEIITGKVDTATIKITATTTDTTTKNKIIRQVLNGNTRRGTPRSLSYMNHLISSQQNLVNQFFRQFNLAMQLRKEELKKQGKVEAEAQVEVTEKDVISTFGVTNLDHMLEVAKILETEGNI